MKDPSLKYFDLLNKAYDYDSFRKAFKRFLLENERGAIYYLNDKRLYFPTLYFVKKEVESLNTLENLNLRNRIALNLCSVIKGDMKFKEISDKYNSKRIHDTLIWMFDSGVYADGLNDEFDEILDGTVGMLICFMKDHSILPSVIDLMFNRYEKGCFIHDLSWYLLQSKDPSLLGLITNRLKLSNEKSIQLACKLLHIDGDINSFQDNKEVNIQQTYSWVNENMPYIYFSGESFQLSSEPNIFKVHLEGKYLNKKVSPDTGEFLKPLKFFEKDALKYFRQSSLEKKEQLSEYSYKLKKQNHKLWRQWIKNDLSSQIALMNKDWEG